MKVHYSKLIGPSLDFAAALVAIKTKSPHWNIVAVRPNSDNTGIVVTVQLPGDEPRPQAWAPSTSELASQRISWHEKISSIYLAGLDQWKALRYAPQADSIPEAHGPTPMVAICRCWVASELDEDVEIPDELVAALV